MYENEAGSFDQSKTIVLGGGNVEYSLEAAVVSLDELIQSLEEAKNDGAEFVVMSSGNYRGASWAGIGTDFRFLEDDE